MIFRELSNAVFRFVLRCAGAEIDGWCSNIPPPAGGGKFRGLAGRGLKEIVHLQKLLPLILALQFFIVIKNKYLPSLFCFILL